MSLSSEIKNIKEFLDESVDRYNSLDFIEKDPIQIPHLFTDKKDIEISGFLTATIAWGKRNMIINNAKKIMEMMDYKPYLFITSYREQDLKIFEDYVHRTFNGVDLKVFIHALRNIYFHYGSLEALFKSQHKDANIMNTISRCRSIFLGYSHVKRTEKHFANPEKGSAAKRINMWLRWMCRQDNKGVDFGIWKTISPSHLSCPLDVHSGRVARELGLLHRKQNDAKAVLELDTMLRKMDSADPVKYDFALFGLGVEGVI